MIQTLYGLVAIFLIAIISLHLNRGIHANEQKMILNEIATDVVEVGTEILDEIGKGDYWFDPATPPMAKLNILTKPDTLADPSTFGITATCNPNTGFSGCHTINDFHGKTGIRWREVGRDFVRYDIEDIQIRYVTESSPHVPSGMKTFAKEAVVTISSPQFYLGSADHHITVQMSRVYLYPKL